MVPFSLVSMENGDLLYPSSSPSDVSKEKQSSFRAKLLRLLSRVEVMIFAMVKI